MIYVYVLLLTYNWRMCIRIRNNPTNEICDEGINCNSGHCSLTTTIGIGDAWTPKTTTMVTRSVIA